jgi:hypothetical protein
MTEPWLFLGFNRELALVTEIASISGAFFLQSNPNSCSSVNRIAKEERERVCWRTTKKKKNVNILGCGCNTRDGN